MKNDNIYGVFSALSRETTRSTKVEANCLKKFRDNLISIFAAIFHCSFQPAPTMYCNKVIRSMARQMISANNVRTMSNVTETGRIEKSLNQVTLLGRVGADPQKRGSSDHPVVTFSLATHTNYKYESGEFMQRTDWHRVCVFKPTLRETVYNYLKKGNRVLINGRISYGEIKDDDGNPRPTTSIIADDVIFFQSNNS